MDQSIIIPLYERVKNQIYDDFERLNRQESIVLSARSKRARILALKHFRVKYCRFFNNIFSTDSYKCIKKDYRDLLQEYREDVTKIKVKDVTKITTCCSAVLRDLKITRISFNNDNDAF